MRFLISVVAVAMLYTGCKSTVNHLPGGMGKIDMAFFDSVRYNSDTGFTRIIGAGEFYSAEQYYRGDSIVSKIMKDTAGRITAFVQFHKNIRTAYAEYYSNGQLKAKLLLNDQGLFDGRATYYYGDGSIKSEGVYDKGFFSGAWRNYSAGGVLLSTDEYDANGQLIRSAAPDR
ncbi:hypothetical protein [Agriterribacter sp.]|uniref:toxin-antitoxin system YwqK family antitoxin n=1 Tax=Agriterribacter sp. TaxID=2821509 RepID=UPI002C9E8FD2|nr:hypothetical protein [Agriterribacter sp.]HRP58165.1 hypothetical protein [Agriterribacter sp.]